VQLRYLKRVHIGTSPNANPSGAKGWHGYSRPDYDHLLWLTQVRERMLALVEGDTLALSIALGHTSVKDNACGKDDSRLLQQRVRKVKRRLMSDRVIYRMFKEAA
jgi:hypothetical protein